MIPYEADKKPFSLSGHRRTGKADKGGSHRFLHRLADGKILVIAGQNLDGSLGVAGK